MTLALKHWVVEAEVVLWAQVEEEVAYLSVFMVLIYSLLVSVRAPNSLRVWHKVNVEMLIPPFLLFGQLRGR